MAFDSTHEQDRADAPSSLGSVRPRRADERRRRYQARYAEQKLRGESFFPSTVFKDAVASLVLFLILISLAVFVGAPLEERADPANTAYVPRPEWYFMFLFELLKYFPGHLEWIGVAVVPGLAVLLLLLLPLIDWSPRRHPRQRVLAINLTAAAVVAIGFFTLRAYEVTPTTAMSFISSDWRLAAAPKPAAQARLTPAQEAGKRIYQAQNCAACHQLAGTGGKTGPDLTGVGSRRDAASLHEYVEKPTNVNPGSSMPAFLPPLSHQDVEWLAQYLSTLR